MSVTSFFSHNYLCFQYKIPMLKFSVLHCLDYDEIQKKKNGHQHYEVKISFGFSQVDTMWYSTGSASKVTFQIWKKHITNTSWKCTVNWFWLTGFDQRRLSSGSTVNRNQFTAHFHKVFSQSVGDLLGDLLFSYLNCLD
jgi:hypothetical protein